MAAANTQNPTVTIWIDANDSCKVTQKVEAKEGEKVIFVNKITESVTILFPEGKPFRPSSLTVGEATSPSQPTKVDVAVESGTSGTSCITYPYAVYCSGKKDFCTASAMPIIIVHP